MRWKQSAAERRGVGGTGRAKGGGGQERRRTLLTALFKATAMNDVDAGGVGGVAVCVECVLYVEECVLYCTRRRSWRSCLYSTIRRRRRK
jgi:hypothetical protein